MRTRELAIAAALLALSAPAFAQDAARMTLPASDLVTSAKPYVLTMELGSNVNAGIVSVSVRLRRCEEGLVSEPVTGAGDIDVRQPVPASAAPAQAGSAPRQFEIAVNAADLAEGEYAGDIALEIGSRTQRQAIAFFRMPRDKPADFPFGVYAVNFPKTPPDQEALLREMRATGLNVMSLGHMREIGGLGPIFDRAARLGMQFMPSVNTAGAGRRSEDMLVRLAGGEPRGVCLNRPEVRRDSAQALAALVRHYGTHPAFCGKVYYGDDFTLPLACKDGKTCMACYCDYCRRQFKDLTGSEPPTAPERAGGVIPADDLWLRWMRYRCGEIFGGFMKEMEQATNQADPRVALGLIHGWSEQPFTRVEVGVYPPLSQTATALSSYSYPNLRMQRKDLISHFDLAKMGHRDKEVWMLGLLAMCNTIASPLQVRQNYWNQLAGGYKFISFFSWFDLANARAAGQADRARAALDALTRCGQHKDWILPAVPYWQDPEASSAVLYSFATECFDATREGAGINHLRKIMAFLREALAQHVPMKVLSEEEIGEPDAIRQLTSLSLCDARALPTNVWKAVEDYAAAGGRVTLDLDSRIPVKGATRMSVETQVALAGDCSPGRTKISSPMVTVREFPCGRSASYHVFVNNSADRYWGMPFNYGSPQGNYDHDALVRDDPVEATVEFSRKDRWLFDMSTGAPLGSSAVPLALKLEPSWGMVACALPSRSAELRATGPRRAKTGDLARFRLEMLDDRGRLLDAAFVAKVDVMRPGGRASRYGRYVAFRGSGEFVLPLGLNDETGSWAVSIQGGFPRTSTTLRLAVADSGRKPADLVTFHPAGQ